MFEFMGEMVRCVELRLRGAFVCDVRGVDAANAVTRKEGAVLDNIARGPISHAEDSPQPPQRQRSSSTAGRQAWQDSATGASVGA
ncbi:MAG: hypothetical protein ACJ8GJ_10145 [Vitreoscilla sp.]